MVFIKDFRREFYDVIQNQRVLVLVSLSVDSLCACKILQYLFQCDQVLYTIVPVTGYQDLERAYLENSEGVKYVIMINLGATIDVVETLQPPESVVFFICDSHRPVEVHNVYNQVQVNLLMKQDEIEDIPEFDSVFRDDESDEDSGHESDDGSGSPGSKRRRFNPDALEKRREKRLWEEKKQKLIFDYTEFSGYGTSSAFLIFELAWKMSKDTNDLLWLGIIGVTDQFIHHRIDRDTYIDAVGQMQSHVSRHNHRPEGEENSVSVDCLRISFDQELQLALYRHWCIFDSLCHSPQMACKFRIWTMKGKKRLQEFLADMGLPLVQCKQKFASMDVHIKESIKDTINQQGQKYGFDEQDLFLPSFHAQYGYKNKLCATDGVYACGSILETIENDASASESFLKALDFLNRNNVDSLEKGLELAKNQLQGIVRQVQSFLDMGQIISAGPFLYAFVQEGTPDTKYFTKSICIERLAKFTLAAYCSVSKSKKAPNLPLVLGSPLDQNLGTMLVVGIPPLSEKTCKNFFGKAFEQAGISTGARTMHDYFDSHIIEMKTEDKSKFFDALISLLQ